MSPYFTNWSMTARAMSTGTAKPMPTLPEEPSPAVSICELTPITRPAASKRPPPELPGLIAASTWRQSAYSRIVPAGN